jgi:hypothetical protein
MLWIDRLIVCSGLIVVGIIAVTAWQARRARTVKPSVLRDIARRESQQGWEGPTWHFPTHGDRPWL